MPGIYKVVVLVRLVLQYILILVVPVLQHRNITGILYDVLPVVMTETTHYKFCSLQSLKRT